MIFSPNLKIYTTIRKYFIQFHLPFVHGTSPVKIHHPPKPNFPHLLIYPTAGVIQLFFPSDRCTSNATTTMFTLTLTSSESSSPTLQDVKQDQSSRLFLTPRMQSYQLKPETRFALRARVIERTKWISGQHVGIYCGLRRTTGRSFRWKT